jgi:chorismate-pyruvate lyase
VGDLYTLAGSDSQWISGVNGFAAAVDLLRRHFVMQDNRPPDVGDIRIGDCAPCLRSLLFTDGMVTRSVEVQTFCRVVVEVVDQTFTTLPVEVAELLMLASTDEALRRRVLMRVDGRVGRSMPFAYAESYLVTRRLPTKFLEVLSVEAGGLGEALSTAQVESRRELLWCGVRETPSWATVVGSGECFVRSYRIVTDQHPAIVVLEGFMAFDEERDARHASSAGGG